MKATRFPGVYRYTTARGETRYAVWASTGSGRQRSRKGLRSLEQARAVKAELENAGTAPAALTMSRFLEERWLPSIVGRPNTRRTARVHARYISRAIGDVKLQRLEPFHAEQLKSWLARSNLSANTNHSCFGIFRRALRHALRQGLISRNIASPDYVDSPRRQRRRPDIATLPTPAMIDAVQTLLRVADSTRFGLIVRTAIMSGLRESEIFGLEWRHVDFATGWLHVTRESTKTDAGERSVFVDVDLLERLRTHRADQIKRHGEPVPTHVFTTRSGRPWTQAGFWKHWDNIRRAADLPGLHFHDLRHLQGTLLQRANVHMSVAARRLGHVDATMTSLYTHSNRAEQEAAVEAVASLFHRKEGGR